MRFFLKIVYWLLPDWFDPGSKRMSNVLTLGWGLLITFFLQVVYFILFYLSDFKLGMTINVISVIFAVISALLLKYTRLTNLAANIVVAIIFFNTSTNAYFTGGLNSSILLWIFIIPIVSIFILKRWHGFFWISAAHLVLTLFYVFSPGGSPDSIMLIENHDFDIWINLVMLVVVIWYSAVVIDNAKNSAIEEAIAAREDATRFANELEVELEQRKLVELALRESEERLDLAIRGADMGLWDWNVTDDEIARNETHEQMLGYEPGQEKISFAEWMAIVHPEDYERVEQAINEHLEGHASIFRSEYRVRKKDGTWIWLLASGAVTTRDEAGKASRMVGITLDITDKKLYEAQLQHLANTDALTGLINRRHFFMLAQTEFNRAKRYDLPMSIAMIDIDHFKRVNDRHGHLMGDQVLFQFARLFKDCIRDMDILARYGGEEFVILFPHTSADEALESAERIRTMIEENAFDLGGEEIQLTASLGIAYYSEDMTPDVNAMLELADKALYRSKDGGRNRVAVWNGFAEVE